MAGLENKQQQPATESLYNKTGFAVSKLRLTLIFQYQDLVKITIVTCAATVLQKRLHLIMCKRAVYWPINCPGQMASRFGEDPVDLRQS